MVAVLNDAEEQWRPFFKKSGAVPLAQKLAPSRLEANLQYVSSPALGGSRRERERVRFCKEEKPQTTTMTTTMMTMMESPPPPPLGEVNGEEV